MPTRISRRQLLKAGAAAAAIGAVGAIAPSGTFAARRNRAGLAVTNDQELPTVTLRVLNQGGADTDYFGSVEQAWNAQSDSFLVAFDQSTSTSDKLNALARTQLSGNNPPDIVWLSIGEQPAGSKEWRDAGLLMDLTPAASELGWEARFIPPFWERFTVDEKVWYLANSSSSWSYYYYNPDVFAELGIVVPANRLPTLEEFASWRDKAKAAGIEFIALGNKDYWPAIHHLINMHRAYVPRDRLLALEGTAYADTGVRYTDEDVLRAIKRTQDTFAEGYFAPGPNAMADGEALALFTSGKAAVFQSGFWGAYVIPDAAPADFKLDLFHWPQEDPNVPKALWYGPGNGYAVSSQTAYPDEVIAILDFIISAEGQQISLLDHGLLPTVNAETLPPEETTYPEPTALYGAIVEAQAAFGPASSTFYISNIPEIATEANRLNQDLIDSRITPEAFAQELQQVNEDFRASQSG